MKLLRVLVVLLLFFAVPSQAEQQDFITLASTTSTMASGLYDKILPKFSKRTGIDVHVVAVGTGQANKSRKRFSDIRAVCIALRTVPMESYWHRVGKRVKCSFGMRIKAVRSLAFFPYQRHLVSYDGDSEVTIWDIDRGGSCNSSRTILARGRERSTVSMENCWQPVISPV